MVLLSYLLLFDGVFGFDPAAVRLPLSALGGVMLFADPAVFAAGAGAAVEAEVDAPGVSDFTYATSALSCSSVTCPSNVGMIG